jgi:hypothetical protein
VANDDWSSGEPANVSVCAISSEGVDFEGLRK